MSNAVEIQTPVVTDESFVNAVGSSLTVTFQYYTISAQKLKEPNAVRFAICRASADAITDYSLEDMKAGLFVKILKLEYPSIIRELITSRLYDSFFFGSTSEDVHEEIKKIITNMQTDKTIQEKLTKVACITSMVYNALVFLNNMMQSHISVAKKQA